MPTFNEIIVTKKTDIAWDGGKATENLIPNDGDLVFDSTGGGRSAHEAPLLDELGWATDNNRDTNGGGTPEDDGLTNDSLSVLYAFGEPVTFTATVSPNSPPASPEPVTHAGDLVVDSTGGGTAIFKEVTGLKCEISVIEFSPDQDNGLLLPAVQTGGVSVACGDVGGDNGALGDPVTSDENFVYGGPENADGHAGQKGAWVADVTYERDLINLTGVNGLDGDHGGSTAPVEPRSYTAGHFALDIDGHSSSHLSFYDLIV